MIGGAEEGETGKKECGGDLVGRNDSWSNVWEEEENGCVKKHERLRLHYYGFGSVERALRGAMNTTFCNHLSLIIYDRAPFFRGMVLTL